MVSKIVQTHGLRSLPTVFGTALLRRFLRLICLSMVLGGPGVGWALDHITERAWLEDSSGQMQWPEVADQVHQPFAGVLSLGFGSSVIWLKLRIDPMVSSARAKQGESLILRIRPLYLDDVQVFDPLVKGMVGVTGDRHHPRTQSLEGLDFMLPIALGDAPREIWLRLSSTSTRQIAVQALHPDDLRRLTQKQQMVFALYVAVILIFMLWGLVHWVFSRERVIAAFGLKQATALVFALCSLGYARLLWPKEWPALWLDNLTSISGMAAVTMAIYFHIHLIREFAPPLWARRLMKSFLYLFPVKLLLVILGQPMQAAAINMMEILLAPFIFLLSVLLSKGWNVTRESQKPILPRKVVIGFYVILVLMLAIASFPGLGLSQGGEIPLYLVQAHGLVTAFLMLLILQYREHLQQKRQQETAWELERSRILISQERKIREEQDKLLAMLAHELRTPLATMSLRLKVDAQGSREIRHAIRDMNAVIDRCLQTAQLGDHQLQAHVAPVQLEALVRTAISASLLPERVHFTSVQPWTIHTDQQLLFIVLSNLLENAMKYAAPATPIQLEISPATGFQAQNFQVRMEVRNVPGTAGWPEADKVFQKYYRGPYARRQAGTGLGLFLVSNLVRVLGGRIEYCPDSTMVRFVVWLPS